jgi:hypothetical protein
MLHRVNSGMVQACSGLGRLRSRYHVYCPAFIGSGHDILSAMLDDVEVDLRMLRASLRSLRDYDRYLRLLPRIEDNLAWLAGKKED